MYIKNRYEFNSKILPKFGLGTHARIKIKNRGNSYEILFSYEFNKLFFMLMKEDEFELISLLIIDQGGW